MTLRSAKEALKALLRQPPSSGELRLLKRELATDQPRGAAIVGATTVENALRDLITSRFIDAIKPKELDSLFGPMKPLSSFSAKIDLGYAIGAYGPKTRDDLHLMREIRNAFAHSRVPISFVTPSVAELCSFFNCVRHEYGPSTARQRYEFASNSLFTHLLQRRAGAKYGLVDMD